MSEAFQRRNQKFSRQAAGRINVRSIVNLPRKENNFPEKSKKNPTPGDVLNDYLESTSVHGLQYFGKIGIKVGVPGKILWTCTILTCFVCLSLMVVQFLQRYNQNPTNTYIKTFEAPIYQAPFPAVTVCPISPISLKTSLAILENCFVPENVSREVLLHLLQYGHHMTHPYSVKSFEHFDVLKEFLNVNKWTVPDFLKILTPCANMFESCWWSGERIDCNKYMEATRSVYGMCCSFNYRLAEYIGAEKGQQKLKLLSSPDFGRWSGLKLVIDKEMLAVEDNTEDFMKITYTNGIMILTHHSMDYPGLNSDTYILRANTELEIPIKPVSIVKPKGFHHRNRENQLVPLCFTDKENPLEYFPAYRNSNCYANCRIKLMIQICGCVPFIFDHIAEAFDIPHCELDGLQCIRKNLIYIGAAKNIQNKNFHCACGVPCEDVEYNGLPNSIPLMKANFSRSRTEGTATVRVYMYSQFYQILETLPAADKTYLLASIGGIFSLFLGCSFLSLIEIVYFAYLFCRSLCSRCKTEPQTKQIPHENPPNRRRYVY